MCLFEASLCWLRFTEQDVNKTVIDKMQCSTRECNVLQGNLHIIQSDVEWCNALQYIEMFTIQSVYIL